MWRPGRMVMHLKRIYKILRGVVMTCIVLAIVVPALTYVALSLPWVQEAIRVKCEKELTALLNVEVSIDDLGLRPFNRATLRGVTVVNRGDTLLKAQRIAAGINIYELLAHGNIAVDYAEVTGPDVRLHRASPGAPLNLQPVIDALRVDKADKAPTAFDVRVNTVVIRRGSISYDVMSAPHPAPGVFDPNHIKINDLRADLNLPRLSNDDYRINLRRMALAERSGLEITDMHAILSLAKDDIGWKELVIGMPRSEIIMADVKVSAAALGGIATGMGEGMLAIGVEPGSHIYLPDIAPLLPELRDMRSTVDLDIDITANRNRIGINRISISDRAGELLLALRDGVIDNPLDRDAMHYRIDGLSLRVGGRLYGLVADSRLPGLRRLTLPRGMTLNGNAEGNLTSGRADIDADISDGEMTARVAYIKPASVTPLTARFDVTAKDVDLAKALGRNDMGRLNGHVKGEATLAGRRSRGEIEGEVEGFNFGGHNYGRLTARAGYNAGAYSAKAVLTDDAGNIDIDIDGDLRPGREYVALRGDIDNVNLHDMGLPGMPAGYTLDGTINADLRGALPDRADGTVDLEGLRLTTSDGKQLALNDITLRSRSSQLPRHISIESDIINGDIEGDFKFATLGPALKRMALAALPALGGEGYDGYDSYLSYDSPFDDFDFSFTLDNLDGVSDFFNLPVHAIYPIDITGNVDASAGQATLDIDAPYLRQGDKLIEGSQLTALIDAREGTDRTVLNTSFPSKDGMTAVTLALQARNNVVDTDINWKIDRQRDYSGSVSLSTLIGNDNGRLLTDTDLHASTMTFNDSVWSIAPARIATGTDGKIEVADFEVSRSNQFVKIDGTVSADPDDRLDIDVLNLNLDYIFEAVGIENVKLGGDATGELTASALLTPEPHISTEGIHVKDISYNRCVLGDADVLSWWDNEQRAVAIDGTIHQPNGKIAKVEGEIFPMSSSLDIRLKPNDTPVGFMEEYMKAFASDISGYGTGEARIYGTFSDIDMEGDLYVNDLRLKLDFTNTYFTASDSIKITPGRITLNDVTLSDPYGHTATLNGVVRHEFFRAPTFDFAITGARGMLVYDGVPGPDTDWYGKIFVDGGATIKGEPGVVKIDVEATTTAGTSFSFVLSELEIADEYTFLTFRDKDAPEGVEEVTVDERMGVVEHLRQLLRKGADEESSDYIIELRVNITPQAEVILVMDPVGGDRIRSHGQGNMRMVYTSADNDLRMFGTYTLERGTYNFTLQDIIIKDFIINSGSSIAFTDDPLTARLNIEAIYALNANLSDLDESFLQDKELNRTNVPVHAILKVTGDIQQPEIKFDLAFPTLTSDTDRKVRSIVSTEEMMNRQIIYLLALNRFYTPDYMGATTKGNELFSVASSTISSQLSNILGHLSDNWSVSPNFRSDRGDFSDMEVDVALSSRLLNNRLLLNGNLGYRDNLMNSNRFIGDFSIEYLLNRSGTIRLKAYNFYNDQNYYLRTADTTQGVGVMFKKDFDNIFSFLRRKKKEAKGDVADEGDTPDKTARPNSPEPSDVPDRPEEGADSTATATPLLQFKSKQENENNK